MPGLLLIALATLVSEDLTCIATGVLVAQGKLGFLPGMLARLLGIFFGDILLFLMGRVAGRAAFRWKVFQKFASPEKVERASRWLSERGMAVILLSRFTPGLRLTGDEDRFRHAPFASLWLGADRPPALGIARPV